MFGEDSSFIRFDALHNNTATTAPVTVRPTHDMGHSKRERGVDQRKFHMYCNGN